MLRVGFETDFFRLASLPEYPGAEAPPSQLIGLAMNVSIHIAAAHLANTH